VSHFTTVETQIKNFVILQRVIEKLGYKLKQNVTHIRGYRQEKTEVDYVIDTKSSIDIGIKKVGENYHFVADWENLETHAGIEQNEFLKQIKKAYAYENVMAEIKKKGYIVADEKTDQQQHVHITLRKWG
jgi:hypothetical protein